MENILNFLPGVTDWTFLQEPLYRWFIFAFLAMPFLAFSWHGILELMK